MQIIEVHCNYFLLDIKGHLIIDTACYFFINQRNIAWFCQAFSTVQLNSQEGSIYIESEIFWEWENTLLNWTYVLREVKMYRLKYFSVKYIYQCSNESIWRFLLTALSNEIRLSFLVKWGKSLAAAVVEIGDFFVFGGGKFLGQKTFCFSDKRFIRGTFPESLLIGESEGSTWYFFRTWFSSPIWKNSL